MKPILAAIAATGLLGGAGMAVAADLSPRIYAKAVPADPGYNWSGFYAGVHAGYTFGDDESIVTTGQAAGNILNVAGGARPGPGRWQDCWQSCSCPRPVPCS